MFELTYTIGFLMVAFTGYLLLRWNSEFKAVKVETREYIRSKRKKR
jgi:hypothetical protein